MTEVYHMHAKNVKLCGKRQDRRNIYYNMCSEVDRLQEFGFAHFVLVAEAVFGRHLVEAVLLSLADYAADDFECHTRGSNDTENDKREFHKSVRWTTPSCGRYVYARTLK